MRLYSKIILCVGLASVFAGQGIIVYSRKAVHASLLVQIEQAGYNEARTIGPALAAAMATGDERRILPLLQAYRKSTDGVYAAALNERGRVLSHSNVAEVGKILFDPEIAATLRSGRVSSRETHENKKSLLELTIPVHHAASSDEEDFLLERADARSAGARAGLLRVGLPMDEALVTERLISSGILRVVLALGGITGLLLFFFMRRVFAPIGLLSAAADKIREGDYRVVVPVTSGDEIGALARSFNAMSRELAQTTVSKNYFNGILDRIADPVIVTDAQGVIVLVNPAVGALLGWSAQEILGRRGSDLLDGTDVSFQSSARNAETRFMTKSGERIAVLLSTSPLTAENGRVTGYIGTAKDVTELRKLEARMRQSEKLSAVGQLAAGVAHEINNPLGVILGFAQILARQSKPGDELELPVKSIEREALRCKSLVQNLLTFARTSRSELTPVDLNQAVEQALSLIAPQAKINRVAVTTSLGASLPQVLANKNQLEQVILNLAKNAIDAMPGGGVLTLSTELLKDSPRPRVCLSVVDDGGGIPSAVLPKIFDPFFTTKAIGQGTGLGLSLVSEIVQKHAGEITVESRPGRTVFAVKLPCSG